MANLGWWQTWAIVAVVVIIVVISRADLDFWLIFALGVPAWVGLWFAVESYGKRRFDK